MPPASSNAASAPDRAAQWEILRRAFALEDNERSRAARELHDRAGQSLAACQLLLAHLLRVGPDARESAVAELQRLMDDLAADLTGTALTLRPVVESDAAFAAQLENFMRDWAQAARVSLEVHLPGLAAKLPALIAGTVYRVVQEALRNVAQHAHARGVSVIAERRSDVLAVIVEDDGQGFDPASTETGGAARKGGIALMRERAALVGAELQIESSRGHGTAVHLRIPLAPTDVAPVAPASGETNFGDAEKRLRAALVAARMATWRWDPRTDSVVTSETMADAFGLSAGVVVGSRAMTLQLVHPDDIDAYRAHVETAARSGGSWHCEFRIVRPCDGQVAWIEERAQALVDPVTGRVAIEGLVCDVTERRRAEETLREADRRKNEFLAILGHELRNPLSAIKGGLALLQSETARPAARAAVLPIVVQQVAHMERLIDDVLDLARIKRGRLQVRPEWIDLGVIVEQAVVMLDGPIAARPVHVSRDLPAEALVVHADPVRLTQVLVNLLSNAIRFSPPGGTIELSARRTGGGVFIRVRDHGPGIEPELLPWIFDGFVRSKRPVALQDDGLGLGLAVSRQLVELHGGTIEARTAGEDQGSEFVIQLPGDAP